MKEEQTYQLNACSWFLEQEKKTEALLNHMRHVMGTFETNQNTTLSFLEGYLSGIKMMRRKFEDQSVPTKEST